MPDPDSKIRRQSQSSSLRPSELSISFSETDEILNPDLDGTLVTWEDYEKMRCQLAHVCTGFGSIGPGFFDDSLDAHTTKDPDYWIVDDQYNDQDKFVFANVQRRPKINSEWIQQVAAMLASNDSWAVSVGFDDGFFVVYADRIVAGGEMFRGCSTLQSLVDAARITDTWD